MSLLAYQQMKPSGIEYVGDIPNDWSSKRLGDLVGFAQGKAHEPYIDDDGEYICVNSRFVSTSGKTIKTCSVNLTPASLNDILMVMSDLPNGRALARAYYVGDHGKYAVNQRVCRITAERAHPRFLFYLLDRHPGLMQNDDGVHQTHLSNADFQKLKLYLPSASEQTQITRFLDHETARIDALIDEQQRLIELLKEKRQAVISHAVTKGLDPSVPMKDSGVEWLGEVPAHWVVRKLKNLVSVRGGSTPSKEVERYWEGDIPWVSPKDMKSERISNSIDHVSASAIEDGGLNMVKSGAILIVVRGMILIHSVPVAITDVEVTINQDMKAMTPGAELSGDYLSLLLQGVRDAVFQYIDSSAHGTRKLEWERFELIDLPIPSHAEQVSIVSFIEKQKRAIDDLVEQAASAITLMKERRAALISAAVTGKIDVRGWQPPASASSPELAHEAV